MKKITIVEAITNLGLKQLTPEREPGVNKLPAWLKQHGFYELLHPAAIKTVLSQPYVMDLDRASGILNAHQVIDYSVQLADAVEEVLLANSFPVVIGGDCSILLGSALALKRQGRYGVLYLDGHTDFITPAFSQTKAVAGMGLAIVTGLGHDKLTNIDSQKPYIEPRHVFSVGNRDDDKEYINTIQQSDIQYFDLSYVRQQGIEFVATNFLTMIANEVLDGFWIHLDVDVLNDNLMPAVDSRVLDGLLYEELIAGLNLLLASPKVTGMEITILDPDLDPEAVYTEQFIAHFSTIKWH